MSNASPHILEAAQKTRHNHGRQSHLQDLRRRESVLTPTNWFSDSQYTTLPKTLGKRGIDKRGEKK